MSEMTYDIAEVCARLGMTSRTLRFWEQKGIIESSELPFRTRRCYTEAQIETIKKVRVLRALGLPISKIQALQQGGTDLSEAIVSHKAALVASIAAKSREIQLLEEALMTLEEGGDIFASTKRQNGCSEPVVDPSVAAAAARFTDYFLAGDISACAEMFSDTLREYLPLSGLRRVVEDALRPLGTFVERGGVSCDTASPGVIYTHLHYQNMGLRLKLVISGGRVWGFWMCYEELRESRRRGGCPWEYENEEGKKS